MTPTVAELVVVKASGDVDGEPDDEPPLDVDGEPEVDDAVPELLPTAPDDDVLPELLPTVPDDDDPVPFAAVQAMYPRWRRSNHASYLITDGRCVSLYAQRPANSDTRYAVLRVRRSSSRRVRSLTAVR